MKQPILKNMLIRLAIYISVVWSIPATILQAADKPTLFVEAEAFSDRGGWNVDTQFIPNMGSAYLIAHGLGESVENASTEIEFPTTGKYNVYVRTKDWVAPWNAPGTPGKFKLLINSIPLATTFGTTGAEWHWQPGGTVEITQKKTKIALKDLTGFAGRCDAIVFTQSSTPPPNDDQTLFDYRHKHLGLPKTPPVKSGYDLVVIGGGYSGLGAAISAARQGLKVALIQDRAVLGGNGSSEVHVWAKGKTTRGKYPHLGEIIGEFSDYSRDSPGLNEEFVDDLKEQVVRAEKNIDLYLNHFAFRTLTKENKIQAVDAVDTTTGHFIRFEGAFFCDATGHGTIGAHAGAKFQMTLKGHMGTSNMWTWEFTNKTVAWPETPWALPLKIGDFPKQHLSRGPYKKFYKAEWFWESGFDKHPIDDLELIRDWNLRANYGAFSALKHGKEKEKHANAKLLWMSFVGGTRESRRLEGDIILTGDDVVAKKEFPDGCVPTTWSIDLHYPKPRFAKGVAKDNPFIAVAVHGKGVDRTNGYPVPYRCFYSKNISNLFMAGRCISVDREALGTIRVMRTCGMIGEVVGKAAYLATIHKTDPRGVYQKHLPALIELMEQPGRARRDSLTSELTIPDAPPVPRPEQNSTRDLNAAKMKGIVIDNLSAKLNGNWKVSKNLTPYINGGYAYCTEGGSATFPIRVKKSGSYEVRIYWHTHTSRTSTAKATVTHQDGKSEFILDQTKSPSANKPYRVLGTFKFNDVLPATVQLEGTATGTLAVDAIQLIPSS